MSFFPELESLPHADTLFRLLGEIDPNTLEQTHISVVNKGTGRKNSSSI